MSQEIETPRSGRMHTVDLLKGAAVICVILCHVQLTSEQRLMLLAPFWIWIGVPVFVVLSGFNYAASAQKSGARLESWFYRPVFLRRLNRFLIPLLFIEILEIARMVAVGIQGNEIARVVLCGGYGPGGYYNSMLLQLMLLFPLIYETMDRKPQTLWVFILGNVAYEVGCVLLNVQGTFYRVCILRYLGALSAGIALWQNRDALMETSREKRSMLPVMLTLLGILCLYATCYGGYRRVLFLQWHNTSLYTVPLAFGIICLTLRLEKRLTPLGLKLTAPLRLAGKASYHIFLAQMLYFDFPLSSNIRQSLPVGRAGTLISVAADCLICLAAGCAFYFVMQTVQRWLVKRRGAGLTEKVE